MAAKNKEDLLNTTHKEFAKLSTLLQQVNLNSSQEKDGEDTSIKDIIGHRAHWIDLFLGWYRDGQAGKEVFFPAKGYKWSQLKQYNAKLRQDQAGLTWDNVQKMLNKNHKKLVTLIESLTDDQLYDGKMKGCNNDWPTGRWAEAAGPSHYRSAAKYIRQRLKQMA